MKKCLLFATLLVAMFGNTSLWAAVTIALNPNGGEWAMPTDKGAPADYTQSWSISGATIGAGDFQLTEITQYAPYPVMKPGYTFTGWENLVTNYQQDFPICTKSEDVFDGSKPLTVSIANHKAEEYMVNVWLYMDDWKTLPTGTTIIGCKSKGWKLHNPESTGRITFSVYTGEGDDGWRVVDLYNKYENEVRSDVKWSSLSAGWHMFTFIYTEFIASNGAVEYFGFTCLDAANRFTPGHDGGYDPKNGWNSSAGDYNRYPYTTDQRRTNGPFAKPTLYEGDLQIGHENFKGKISGLSVIQRHYQRINATEKTPCDNSLLALYNAGKDSQGRAKTYAAKETQIKAMFDANPVRTITMDKNGGDESTGTNTTSQNGGMSTLIEEPLWLDHVFSHWSNTASDYTSIYQDIPCTKYVIGTDETTSKETNLKEQFYRPYDGGASNIVTFDGTNYFAIADQKYKYTDCFTIHVHARMDDWYQYGAQNMRLFSCNNTGGWNIERRTGTDKDGNILYHDAAKKEPKYYFDFIGRDHEGKTGVYRRAKTSVTCKQLNDASKDHWHSFTFVFTGRYIHAYIDGKLYGTSDAFAGPFPGKIHYDDDNYIFIGAEAGAAAGLIESGYNFKGKMRNFCILHTALTPSQVKDLHENMNEARCYHAPNHTTLTANWIPLTPLAADEINAAEFFVGDEPVEQTISITGNDSVVPTVTTPTLETGWSEVARDVNSKTTGNSITLQYDPHTIGTHEATIEVTSKYSSTKTVKAKNKTYRRFAYNDVIAPTEHIWKGETVEKTLSVTGDGHTAPTVDFQGSTPFSFTFTKTPDKDGATADFKYAPAAVGKHSATLHVASNSEKKEGNTYNKTITLNYYAHEFEVAYWKDNGCAVKIDSELQKTTINFNGKDVTLTRNNDGTYTLPIDNIRALQNTKVKTKFKGNNWDLSTDIRIPEFEDVKPTDNLFDVIVDRNDHQKHEDADNAETINDLYVKAKGKFEITTDALSYTSRAVILYSEGDEMPHLILPEGTTLNTEAQKIYFMKRIKGDRYYEVTLPFDCNIADIRLDDKPVGEYKRGVDWEVLYYDGQKLADYDTGWQPVKETALKAGQGYTVAIDATGETTRELVFPMTVTHKNLSDLDNKIKSVPVWAYGIGQTAAHRAGWNLVGNPYFTTFGKYDNENTGIKLGDLSTTYITVPNKDDGITYHQKLYTEWPIQPFSVFFVQVSNSENLTFTPSSATSQEIVARKMPNAGAEPIYVGVKLSNGNLEDETSLVIGKQFTQAYEIGSDLDKKLGLGKRPQVYVTDATTNYAFKSLNPTDAAGINDLGVYLPAEGEYTFSIKDTYDLSQVQALYLTDRVEGVTVNLVQSDYTFTSTKAHTTNRFTLGVALSADVATNLTDTEANWAVWQDSELHIRLQGMNVGDEIRVFDITGRLIYQTQAIETEAAFDLPTAGTYCVQTISEAGNVQIKKINIK